MRTLVVTNSQGALAVVGSVVEEANGHPIIGSATTMEQALEAIKRLKPEVVILDMQTPHDGVDDPLDWISSGAKGAEIIAVCDSAGNMSAVKNTRSAAVVLWGTVLKKLPWILDRIAERRAKDRRPSMVIQGASVQAEVYL